MGVISLALRLWAGMVGDAMGSLVMILAGGVRLDLDRE